MLHNVNAMGRVALASMGASGSPRRNIIPMRGRSTHGAQSKAGR